MQREDENRVAYYIKKHMNYKRWLAFALCLSLLVGTVTLYMMNKPATAMTEEGAQQVGLVLETASSEYEQEVIDGMLEGGSGNSSEGGAAGDASSEASSEGDASDSSSSEGSSEESGEETSQPAQAAEGAGTGSSEVKEEVTDAASTGVSFEKIDVSGENSGAASSTGSSVVKAEAGDTASSAGSSIAKEESVSAASSTSSSQEASISASGAGSSAEAASAASSTSSSVEASSASSASTTEAATGAASTAGASTTDTASAEASVKKDEKTSASREEKLEALDVPKEVNLAEYVTETIIERLTVEGKWERTTEDEILPGDKLRVTFNYELPKNAVVSEDIHLNIPEELGVAEQQIETSMEDGKGSYEIKEKNQIVVQYSDDVKEEIIENTVIDESTVESTESQNLTEDENKEGAKLQSYLSIKGLINFASDLMAFIHNSFVITVYAANDSDMTSGSVTAIIDVPETTAQNQDKTARYDIDYVSAKKASQYGTNWTVITDGATVQPTDKLKFNLHFNIRQGTLGTATEDDRQIVYNLNDWGIKLLEPISNAPVYIYGTTTQVGIYSISSEGVATITYFKDYAAQNSKSDIDGTLEFTSSVIDTGKTDGSDYQYKFFNDVTFDIKIKTDKAYGIELSKEEDDTKVIDGNISYKIKVFSQFGTNEKKVYLEDILSVYNGNYANELNRNSAYESLIDFNNMTVSVDGADGKEQITKTGNKFSAVLPAMTEGKTYTITYTLPVPSEIRDNLTLLGNKASAYIDKDNIKYAETSFSFDSIPTVSKRGEIDSKNRIITWTITLNSKNANLNGYTLEDVFMDKNASVENGTPYTGEVSVSPAINGMSNVTLPHTFSADDYNTYTFTFKKGYNLTDATDYGLIGNHVSIYKEVDGEKKEHYDNGYVSVGGSGAVVEKKSDSISEDSESIPDHKTVTIKWNVALKAPIYKNEGIGNAEFWTYYDEIAAPGYINDEELSSIQQDLRSRFDSRCIVSGDPSSAVYIGDNRVGYRYFTIKFYEDLTGDSDFLFSYKTKGDIGLGLSDVDFRNTSWVFNKGFKSEDTQKYYPVVEKYDGNSNSTKTSTYDYYDQKLFSSGVLTWKFRIAVPEKYSDELTVYENLQSDVVFVGNSFNYQGVAHNGLEVSNSIDFSSASGFVFDDNNGTATFASCNFNAMILEDGRLAITIPSDTIKAFNGSSIYFRVRAKISDNYEWPEESYAEFTNEVDVHNSKDDSIGISSHTMSITKTAQNISKHGEIGVNNTVSYRVEINPKAADLLQKSDELTLEDILSSSRYEKNGQVGFTVTLIPGSVKVYEIKEGGSITVITPEGGEAQAELLNENDYSYSINSMNNYEYKTYTDQEFLIMKIPDRKHLLITYDYSYSGEAIFGQDIKISNKATLKGLVEGNEAKTEELKLQIEDSNSETGIKGIRLYKIDNESMGIFLDGASFDLYRYNSKTGKYDIKERSITTETDLSTGEKGKAVVTVDYYNTAYMLQETVAPVGYNVSEKPYYFMVKNTSDAISPSYANAVKPDGFDANGGIEVSPSQEVYFKDISKYTKISINKYWNDEGKSSYRPQSISVKLARTLGNDVTGNGTSKHSIKFKVYVKNGDLMGNSVRVVTDGSIVRFSLTHDYNNASNIPPVVTMNGSELNYNKCTESTGYERHIYHYSFSANENKEIIIRLNDWNNTLTDPVIFKAEGADKLEKEFNYWLENGLSIEEPETVEDGKPQVIDSEFPMNITLTAASGWTWTSDKLDRYYYPKDENGNVIYKDGYVVRYEWLYYFSEYNSVYYDAQFSENNTNGINYGTISLTNTRNEVEGYELPQTGGTGTMPYTVLGIGLTGAAVVGEETVRRRRKKNNPAK